MYVDMFSPVDQAPSFDESIDPLTRLLTHPDRPPSYNSLGSIFSIPN